MMRKYMLVVMAVPLLCFGQNTWTETTQSDFADGIYERNIYASHLDGGTVEFAPRFDLNNDGYIDLYTADRFGPYVRIYWGSAGGYSAGNLTLFPSSGGANCDVADLDNDGFPEFVVSHYFEKTSIYWGSVTGPNPGNYLDFPMVAWNRQGVFIADFDKDGYLDITVTQEIIPGNSAIFWGSASGYSINNRTDLPCYFGVHNIEVADLNSDTWLDIIFVQYTGSAPGQFVIYWGSSSGFSSSSATLSIPAGGHGVSVADLNKDGYLDLVSTGWYDAYSFIYWGGASGYSAGNMQILIPGSCYGGSAVADINDDTYLDILYHRGGYGPDYQKVFWGSASGYSNNNYSDLGMPLETTGGLIADLDFDGDLDIFVNTRTPEYMSYVFSAPSFASTAALPVNQDHHAMFREIGNVYNREYYEDYISSVFEAGGNADWGTIEWDASLPTGSSIMFWIRTGNTPNLDDAWLDWTPFSSGESIPDAFNARYLQYKARLIYTNPCYFPSLEEVRVTYTSSEEAVSNEEVQCSPNPLRNSTMISFPARGSTDASVKIYSINGQLVRNLDAIEYKEAVGVVIWDRKDDGGRRVPAGVYFYAVKDQETSHTGKVIVFD